MVLIKEKIIMKPLKGMKPTKFRFVKNIRLGFKGNEVIEIVKFEETRRKKK